MIRKLSAWVFSTPMIIFFINFIVEPPIIPTTSMFPTIKPSQMFISKKFAYGYNTYSFTHLNYIIRLITKDNPRLFTSKIINDNLKLFDSKIINGNLKLFDSDFQFSKPNRGDIIQFAFVPEELQISLQEKSRIQIYYCKRVIAIPGDKISIRNNLIHINGEPIERRLVCKNKKFYDHYGNSFFADLYEEENNNKKYNIIFNTDIDYEMNFDEIELTKDEYFCMGDNRTGSYDSRFFGPIKGDHITGKIDTRLADFTTPIHKYLYLMFPEVIAFLLVNPIAWIILASFIPDRKLRKVILTLIILFIIFSIILTFGSII